MTTLVKRARASLDGFRGRFFYDHERGDIAWIAKACDDKQCDCEVNVNSDGEQDCSHSISDWKGEDHINEPLVVMLNAVPELVAEVERLRALLIETAGFMHGFSTGKELNEAARHNLRAEAEALRSSAGEKGTL